MRVALVHRPIDVAALLAEVAGDECGATTLFVGTVRDVNDDKPVTGIDYTAYEAMALKEMEAITTEAVERFGSPRLVIEHRLGTLGVRDASVAIAVSHARRAPAMDAARFVIEELKRRVPIWKREHYADGTREWVDPSKNGVWGVGSGEVRPGHSELVTTPHSPHPTPDVVEADA